MRRTGISIAANYVDIITENMGDYHDLREFFENVSDNFVYGIFDNLYQKLEEDIATLRHDADRCPDCGAGLVCVADTAQIDVDEWEETGETHWECSECDYCRYDD